MSEVLKEEVGKGDRPEFRNLHPLRDLPSYKWPLAALVSGAHRFSGLFLVLLLPFVLYLFEQSLHSELSFDYFKGFVSGWFVKLVIIALVWGYLQHFCSGIRHLIMDLHVGLDKDSAKVSATVVFAISLFLTALIALKILGAF